MTMSLARFNLSILKQVTANDGPMLTSVTDFAYCDKIKIFLK